MFNRTTSTKIFAPRRQAGKEKDFAIFSELGLLCAFARGILFPIPGSKIQRTTSIIFD
jgi:hypothetical protein